MLIRTHQKIDNAYCGAPVELQDGYSKVALTTMEEMAVDEMGLVHGGFIFGLADYAAMIAVNHPHVVLGAADVKFTKPVRVGDTVTAVARLEKNEGKKQSVSVTVSRASETVFTGNFICFILEKHVLG
ncbi:MAG: hotdog domain-containing protein [Thermodesulfobacteriota bacterium]